VTHPAIVKNSKRTNSAVVTGNSYLYGLGSAHNRACTLRRTLSEIDMTIRFRLKRVSGLPNLRTPGPSFEAPDNGPNTLSPHLGDLWHRVVLLCRIIGIPLVVPAQVQQPLIDLETVTPTADRQEQQANDKYSHHKQLLLLIVEIHDLHESSSHKGTSYLAVCWLSCCSTRCWRLLISSSVADFFLPHGFSSVHSVSWVTGSTNSIRVKFMGRVPGP
jgi:hypothetical protein